MAVCAACAASVAFATEGVAGDTTFGILKLADTSSTDLVISVPWTDCETGRGVLVSNLVMTTNLTPDDILIRKDGSNYQSWGLTSSGWSGMTIAETGTGTAWKPGVTNITAGANTTRVARGNAFMLHRQDPTIGPIYFYGRYDISPTNSTLIAGETTLVGNPGTSGQPFALHNLNVSGGAGDGDIVIIGSKTYTYKTAYTNWTYKKAGETPITLPNGQTTTVPETVVVHGRDAAHTVTIPAGQGFWYRRKTGNSNTSINW